MKWTDEFVHHLSTYTVAWRCVVRAGGVLCKAPVQNSLPAARRRGEALVKAGTRTRRQVAAGAGGEGLLSGRHHQGWTHVGRRPWRCSASCWTCATSPLPCSTSSRRYGTYHRARPLTHSLSPRLRRIFISRAELPALV